MQLSERRDARRLFAAVLAAILVHVGLIFAIPFLTSLDTAPLPDYGPIVVTLEEPEAAFRAARTRTVAEAVPGPHPSAHGAAGPDREAGTDREAGAGSYERQRRPRQHRPPSRRRPGHGHIVVPAVGRGSGHLGGNGLRVDRLGAAARCPAGRRLDDPGHGRAAFGRGRAAQREARPGIGGNARHEEARFVPRTHRNGRSDGGCRGVGHGTGTAAAAAEIVWDEPDAAKGRGLLSWPDVRLPDTVGKTGLVLEVKVAFSVNADGLVTSARVEHGSGYPDVDAACLEALRQARFTRAKAATELNGSRTIRITLR